MTKETYLEQLKACLTNLEPQEIEDIIAHFHEHIDEACLDEYGIISELGQAEELAKTILESLYPGIDIAINQPISQHLSEQITLSDNIHSLSISLDQLDIIILPSESEEYAIDYPYQDNPYYPSLNYNLTDGHLSLTEEKASRIQNLETTSHFWHGFVKFNNHRKTVVHLYLPEKLNFLDVTTKVGDIEISHLHCQQVKLHSHSADISLKKLGISNIDLFSQNGDIDIEDSQVKSSGKKSIDS